MQIIGKDNIDPKWALIQRTNERLAKFGMINLRTFDTYSLKRVQISDADVKSSPWLTKAQEAYKNMQDYECEMTEIALI